VNRLFCFTEKYPEERTGGVLRDALTCLFEAVVLYTLCIDIDERTTRFNDCSNTCVLLAVNVKVKMCCSLMQPRHLRLAKPDFLGGAVALARLLRWTSEESRLDETQLRLV
jgi:hypothetical protein